KMPFLVENLLVREFTLPDPKVPVLGAWKLSPGGAVAPAGLAPAQGSAETTGAQGAPELAPEAAAETAGPPPVEMWADAAPPTLIDVSHRREFRGMWLATVSNVDWPSRYGLSVERQKQELVAYLDGMETMNMNALIFQIRGAADAFYKSALDPWSRFLTGTQGKDPGYDPLEFAIEECRKRSIELHVWINPFRAMPVEDYPVAKNHISRVLPQFARPYASMIWMDPGAREVRDFVTAAVMDVVTRYEIDGVHLDDYFYPYPENGVEFDDAATYAAYLQCCGQIEKDDWRRQNVDSLIAGLSQQIRATKPYVKFGVSPFGLYRPGEPAGTKGFDQYNGIYSDPKKWLEKGWIDYVTPQLYWRENSNRSYSALLNWWGETNVLRRHIYAGNSLLNIERRNGNWPFSEYETQLNASREAVDQQSLGNIFFGMRVFRGRDGEKIRDRFAEKLYPEPALSPAMPWLGNLPPDSPWHVRVAGGEIRWSGATSPHLKHWALYRRDGENAAWELQEVFPASINSIEVDPGTYALSAVDRLMQESVGVLVEVVEAVEFAGENVKQAGEEAPEEEGAGEG
ncbi:MAG: family 10 glycosylhydrolase, partial [Akkermansiaceae bacterium]|nr:family 10 glycosylhydrolase [Akkermansiaceae bacterium]